MGPTCKIVLKKSRRLFYTLKYLKQFLTEECFLNFALVDSHYLYGVLGVLRWRIWHPFQKIGRNSETDFKCNLLHQGNKLIDSGQLYS